MDFSFDHNRRRKLVKLLVDLVVWLSALPLAFFIRTDSIVGGDYMSDVLLLLGLTLPIKAFALWKLSLFRQSWRRVGMDDLIRLSLAVVAVAVITYVILFATL